MEERSRLGRGLEEISQLYLSDHPRETAGREKKSEALAPQRQAIRLFSPGAALTKSVFLTNLALELARNKHTTAIWDAPEAEKAGAGSLLEPLLHPGLTPDAKTVRLYGLPDILLYQAGEKPEEELDELITTDFPPGSDGYLLINTKDCLTSVVGTSIFFDAILLSTIDEASLLQCYAFIKVIRERDPLCRISLVFDRPDSNEQAREMFSRFAGFVRDRHDTDIHFLGCLTRDDLLERSIAEGKPIVLYPDQSSAKDHIIAAAAAFLQSRCVPSRIGAV